MQKNVNWVQSYKGFLSPHTHYIKLFLCLNQRCFLDATNIKILPIIQFQKKTFRYRLLNSEINSEITFYYIVLFQTMREENTPWSWQFERRHLVMQSPSVMVQTVGNKPQAEKLHNNGIWQKNKRHKTELKTSDVTHLTLCNVYSKHLASAGWFTGCLRGRLCFCTFLREPPHSKRHKSLSTEQILGSAESIKFSERRFLLSEKKRKRSSCSVSQWADFCAVCPSLSQTGRVKGHQTTEQPALQTLSPLLKMGH